MLLCTFHSYNNVFLLSVNKVQLLSIDLTGLERSCSIPPVTEVTVDVTLWYR